MKKNNNTAIIIMTIIGLISSVFIIGGLILIVASFFQPIPVFNGVVIFGIGLALAVGVQLFAMFLTLVDTLANAIETITDALKKTTPNNPPQNQDFFPFGSAFIHRIPNSDIFSETGKNAEDSIFSILAKNLGMTTNIENMSKEQLEKELEKSVKNNEFEKAAEIRDELKKRNNEK